MCEPIVERRQTLAQLDMNAETAATPQREIMMLILWTSFFKMKMIIESEDDRWIYCSSIIIIIL